MVTKPFPRPTSHVLCPLFAVLLSSCAWFTDFKQQPKMDPWETANDTIAMRGNPQGSVPIYGSAAPGFAYGRAQTIADVQSMSGLTNPVAADERSLRNGRMLYSINCSVCHGNVGAGDGPVTRFGFPPIAIGAGSNSATNLSDGYIFGMIRNGRGLMPPYNRIEEPARWDVINYIRALQRGDTAVGVGPLGRPGETGDLVPGAGISAPTRPAPYFRPATSGDSIATEPPTTQPPGSRTP
jgi:mono/diheme cytochrome c family protein